ncbi:MAG: PilZ domain-containing protein [Tepidisphaeraceae bacterium]
MKLTAQHLAQVVNSLHAAPSDSKGAEKRRAARMEVQGNVVVAPVTPDGSLGQSFTALTRDLSFVGIGLLLATRLALGQQIVVRLPRGAAEDAMYLRCTVQHVRPLADGLFVIGAEFTDVAEVKEEQLLGQAGGRELQRIRELILN